MVRGLSNIFLLFFLLTACSPSAEELLESSLEAHGGLEAYRDIATISYRKTTILYDSAGNIESELAQRHKYYFGDVISGSINWEVDSVSHRIEFSGNDIKKYVGEALVEDPTAQGLINSSLYVLFQPFKLKDPGVHVTAGQKKWLGSDQSFTTLEPVFEGGSTDRWWFYVDPDTDLISANLVLHDGRYSFIENLEFDTTTDLVLHRHRKSYFTDSTLQRKVLRAEYLYEGYLIQ